MDFISLIIVAAFLIYMIAVMLGLSKDILWVALIIAAIVTVVAAICKAIINACNHKAIKGFYKIQLNNSPAAKTFYDEALLIIKTTYPNPKRRHMPKCAAPLGLPTIDKESIFYGYYKGLYKNIDGLAILYAQMKSWPTGGMYNYCENEIIKRYDSLSAADEAMLTQFPWLISLSLFH